MLLSRACARGLSSRAPHLSWLVAVEASSPSRIVIAPGWHSHATASVVPDTDAQARLTVEEAPDESLISIALAGGPASELRVVCPERADLHARLSSAGGLRVHSPDAPAGLRIAGKVEGDVTLECAVGDIEVARIKGSRVAVTADDGAVRLRGALDAGCAELDGAAGVMTARVAATTFRADGRGGGVHIGSVYSSSASVSVSEGGFLRVGGVHGTLRAVAKGGGPPAVLRGITGTLSLNAPGRGVFVHFDAPRGASEIIAGGDVDVHISDTDALSVRVRVRARSVLFSEAAAAETTDALETDGSRTFLLRGRAAGEEIARNGGSGKIREGSGIMGFWSDGMSGEESTLSVSTSGAVHFRLLKYDAPPKSLCPRCGVSFKCGASKSTCECATVATNAATREELREKFGEQVCLCVPCLSKIQLV
jgi:hypothetical protein